MKLQHLLFPLALALFSPLHSGAQSSDQPPTVEVNQISDNLYQLRCNGDVDLVASIGVDGTLLVDTGYRSTAPAVLEELVNLGGGPASLVINTHGDGDHVGGNQLLGAGATIIAHPYVSRRMNTYFALPPDDIRGLPTVALDGVATLHFNDDLIRIIPIPGGHTAGDVVVHFTRSNIVCIGDLVLAEAFPSCDPARGGDALRLLEVLKQLRDTLPLDALLVASHGGVINVDALEEYIEMLEGTLAIVNAEVAAGHSLEEIIDRNPLALWWMWEHPESGLSFKNWTTEIYASLTGESVKSIGAPISEAIVENGIEAAVSLYHKLKEAEPENWNFGPRELNMLGYQLLIRERVTEAIAIFKLNVEAFPDEYNTYDSLGEGYMLAGRTGESITNYERSLELNPDNTNAFTKLARLRSD